MKLFSLLPVFFCLVGLPAKARDAVVFPALPDLCQSDAADDSSDTPDKKEDAGKSKDDKRDATRWLNAELKDRTHILALLKKVKDKKSADKIGAILVKEYGNKESKKTAMGDAEPPKRPTGPVMEECEKKFKPKFGKLDKGIAEQLKRIEELNLDSDDLKEGLQAMPKYSSGVSSDSL